MLTYRTIAIAAIAFALAFPLFMLVGLAVVEFGAHGAPTWHDALLQEPLLGELRFLFEPFAPFGIRFSESRALVFGDFLGLTLSRIDHLLVPRLRRRWASGCQSKGAFAS